MSRRHRHRSLPAIAVLATTALAGCSTPPEVRELAGRTAATVGTISAHLRQLDQNSRDIATQRAAIVARLHSENARIRAEHEYDVELTRQTGGDANLKLIKALDEWAKKDQVRRADFAAIAAEREKRVLDAQQRLDTRTQALAEVAQGLAELAKEEKARDRASFLAGYARDLKKELDDALAQDDDTARAAKDLIDRTGKELSDAR